MKIPFRSKLDTTAVSTTTGGGCLTGAGDPPTAPENFVVSETDQLLQFGYGATLNARGQFAQVSPSEVPATEVAHPLAEYTMEMEDSERNAFFWGGIVSLHVLGD